MADGKQDFVVHDWNDEAQALREIRFTGYRLAHVSSQEPGKPRWVEYSLYRTAAGKYVLERVGHSVLKGERTRFRTIVSDGPEGAIEAVYQVDADGIWFLNRIGSRLLSDASQADALIRAAFMAERID